MLANVEKSRTNVYLNKVRKEEAKAIFKEYGMGLSDAINIFLTQSVLKRGIPFEVTLPEEYTPNAETIQAIEEADDVDSTSWNASLEDIKSMSAKEFSQKLG